MLACVWFSQVDFLNSVIVDLQVRFVSIVGCPIKIEMWKYFWFYSTDPDPL